MPFAGVLPYAYDREGRIHLLIAREAFGRDKGKWSSFAGGIDAKDRSMPIQTAAREAYEESMGLLGPRETLVEALERSAIKIQVENGVQYLLQIQLMPLLSESFQGVRAMFRAVNGTTTTDGYSPFLEKDEIAWIALDRIRRSGLRFRYGFWRDIDRIQDALRRGPK